MNSSLNKRDFDVVIAGGGAAGSCAGVLLAQNGLDVLILNQSQFPGFSCRECLLPLKNGALHEMGMDEKIRATGLFPKDGATFSKAEGGNIIHVKFSELFLDFDSQERGEPLYFQHILLDYAKESGCTVWQQSRVTHVSEGENGYIITAQRGAREKTVTASWIIDASGNPLVSPVRPKEQNRNSPSPRKIAVYSLFKDMPGFSENETRHIVLIREPDEWCWITRVAPTLTSVGLVATTRESPSDFSPEGFFRSTVCQHPFLSRWLDRAKPVDAFHTLSDSSYFLHWFSGKRLLRVGDAAGFVDPVLSSGILLSTELARLTAHTILQAARKGAGGFTGDEQRHYTSSVKKAIATHRTLVKAFYDTGAFPLFLCPVYRMKIAEALNGAIAEDDGFSSQIFWRLRFYRLLRESRIPIVAPSAERWAS